MRIPGELSLKRLIKQFKHYADLVFSVSIQIFKYSDTYVYVCIKTWNTISTYICHSNRSIRIQPKDILSLCFPFLLLLKHWWTDYTHNQCILFSSYSEIHTIPRSKDYARCDYNWSREQSSTKKHLCFVSLEPQRNKTGELLLTLFKQNDIHCFHS